MRLLKNNLQKCILFADKGVRRWQSAPVASAIIRRLNRHQGESICINRFDILVVNRMIEVLYIGGSFNNFWFNGSTDVQSVEISVNDILKCFPAGSYSDKKRKERCLNDKKA